MAWPLARSVCSSEPRSLPAACQGLLMLTASRSRPLPRKCCGQRDLLCNRELLPKVHHGICRYAGLVTCTGFRKEGDKLVEVHGEFQPLKAGQKLPKAKLSILLCCVPCRGSNHLAGRRRGPA